MITEEADPRLVCYDDVWVFDLAPRPLNESSEKWVTPEVQRDRDKKRQNKLGDPEFVRRMKTVTTQSMNEWQQYQRSLWYDLQRLFHGYLQHNVTPIELERQSAIMIRDAYVKAYKLGLASSELRRQTGSTPVRTKADTEWVKKAYRTAMQEWRAFVHKFVTRNLGGTHWPDRIRAFIHQIDTAFQSARATTIGADTLIFWVGPHDHRTCPGCSLLFANNPYTRDTLPCSPRSGSTPCRHNCRDHLLVRKATKEEIDAVLGGKSPAKIKADLIKKLTAIMQPGMTYNASTNRPMKKKGYKPRKLPPRRWVAQDHNFF